MCAGSRTRPSARRAGPAVTTNRAAPMRACDDTAGAAVAWRESEAGTSGRLWLPATSGAERYGTNRDPPRFGSGSRRGGFRC